jgi:hypothetical protein
MAAPTLPFTSSGTLPYGAGTITPTTGNYNTTSYIVDRIDLGTSLTTVRRFNTNGAPNGVVGFRNPYTLSGALQLATTNATTDSMPEEGATFVWPVRGTNTNFFFVTVGTAREIRSFYTAPFTAEEVA